MKAARERSDEHVIVVVEPVDHGSEHPLDEWHLGRNATMPGLKRHSARDIDQNAKRGGCRTAWLKQLDRTFLAIDAERKIARAKRSHDFSFFVDHRDRDSNQSCGIGLGRGADNHRGWCAKLHDLRRLEDIRIETLLRE